MKHFLLMLLTAAMLGLEGGLVMAAKPDLLVYVGTYTRDRKAGIYLLKMNRKSGELTPVGEVDAGENPSFLAIHPNKKYLYAVNETGNYKDTKGGAVSAFAIDRKTGQLTFLNREASNGAAPCHLVVDQTGSAVLVANYTGGNVGSLPIGEDGKLQPMKSNIQHQGSSVHPRQKGPHAHSINLDADNRFAFAADLGLDQILVYKFDDHAGTLTPHDPAYAEVPAGSGPRHFSFHPSGKFAYAINELSSTVTAFAYDAKAGKLTPLQTLSTLPQNFEGNNSTAEVQITPDGQYLFGSNRGHDSLAMFVVDQETGKLTPNGHQSILGKTPRNFAISPGGKFILAAGQGSDSIAVFRINKKTGKLKFTGTKVEVPVPVCIKYYELAK